MRIPAKIIVGHIIEIAPGVFVRDTDMGARTTGEFESATFIPLDVAQKRVLAGRTEYPRSRVLQVIAKTTYKVKEVKV